MDLESIMLSEISHTEKDKYCMISLKNKRTNITKQKQSHRYREQTGEKGHGRWEIGVGDWGRNFQLQNKWLMAMKCTVWVI